jgi:hypothetical protein
MLHNLIESFLTSSGAPAVHLASVGFAVAAVRFKELRDEFSKRSADTAAAMLGTYRDGW